MIRVARLAALTALAVVAFWLFVRDRADHAAGQKLYVEHCASCHGETLQGQPDWQTPKENGRLPAPPHDATGHTWHHSDAELFGITKYGMSAIVPGHESDMPGFGLVLTDEQIGAILSFIKNTWPKTESEYQKIRTRSR